MHYYTVVDNNYIKNGDHVLYMSPIATAHIYDYTQSFHR